MDAQLHDLEASTERTPMAHLGELVDELETERRLLDELARVLVAQREGISSDDLASIDESVFGAQRILRTLQEARRRRRTLLQLLGVEPETELRELGGALGPRMTPELNTSRDELLQAAMRLSRELTVNRRVVDGALEVGNQLLRAFTGSPERPNLYAQGSEPAPKSAAGALFNTRV
jgi:flagellar biosynthesis/type III secretory pathway chaperone